MHTCENKMWLKGNQRARLREQAVLQYWHQQDSHQHLSELIILGNTSILEQLGATEGHKLYNWQKVAQGLKYTISVQHKNHIKQG